MIQILKYRETAEKELGKLETKKAKADAKAAEAESLLKKLLVSGMSADEILEKLKTEIRSTVWTN